MNENGAFKFVQFTDIHFGEGDRQDDKNYQVMTKVLETEMPDFAVITGDIVSGYAWDGLTRPWYSL